MVCRCELSRVVCLVEGSRQGRVIEGPSPLSFLFIYYCLFFLFLACDIVRGRRDRAPLGKMKDPRLTPRSTLTLVWD